MDTTSPRATPEQLLEHATWLRRLALGLVGEPAVADDLVQETWLASIRNPPEADRPLRPWLATVLRNFARMRGRTAALHRAKHEAYDLGAPEADPAPSAEEALARHRTLHLLSELVERLDEPYRGTVLLWYAEGLEPKEIARRQGVPDGTVRWRLKEGLEQLRRELDRVHGGDRKAWRVVLLGLFPRGRRPPPAAPAISKAPLLAAAVAAIVVGGAGVFLAGRGGPPAAPSAAPGAPARARSVTARAIPHFVDEANGTVVEGVVLTPAGAPAPGALVAAHPLNDLALVGAPPFSPPALATTDARGAFRFVGLAPGRHALAATAAGATAASVDVTLARDEHKSGVTGVTIRLGREGATLRGRVADSGGGPLAGADVLLVPTSPIDLRSDGRTFAAVTGPDGAFALAVPKGDYDVVAQANGYVRERRTFVPLTADLVRDFELDPAAHLEGIVLDEAGAPAAGAAVLVETLSGAPGDPIRAGADGRFAFEGISPGSYRVVASRGAKLAVSAPVASRAASRASDVTLRLSDGPVLSGRVVAPDGRPVPGASVIAVSSGARGEAIAKRIREADEAGRFVLEALTPGTISLAAAKPPWTFALPAPIAFGETSMEVELRLAPGVALEGTLVGPAGAPAVGVPLLAWTETEGGTTLTGVAKGRSGPGGAFRLEGLAPGRIRLRAEAADVGQVHLGPIALAAGTRALGAVRLAAGAFATGEVRWDDGAPAAGVVVRGVQRAGVGYVYRGAATDRHGRYRIGPFVAGTGDDERAPVRLAAGQVDGLLTPQDRLREPEARELRFERDGVEAAPPLVLPRPMRLAGVVRGPDGAPLAGARVAAAQSVGRVVPSDVRIVRTTTDLDGRFSLEVPKGTYEVVAGHAGLAPVTRHDVAAGTTDLRMDLARGGRIAGLVVDARGAPVPSFSVRARRVQGEGGSLSSWARSGRSEAFHDPAGRFELSALTDDPRFELLVGTADGQGAFVREVAAGTTDLRVVVGPMARVKGRVLELGTGTPLPRIGVVLSSAGASASQVETDADGRFVIGGAIPGAHHALVFGSVLSHVTDGIVMPIPERGGEVDAGTIVLVRGPQKPRGGTTGLSFVRHGLRTVVHTVSANSPAGLAGIAVGEELLSVDGRPAAGLPTEAVRFLYAGEAGQPVTFELRDAAGKTRKVTVTRVSYSALK